MGQTDSFSARFVRLLVRRTVSFYYPRIEITGRDLIPSNGPILFVANHANSLIDPAVVGRVADRPVHFLAKAPLFEVPVLGALMKAFGMLPAYRGSDDPSQVGGNLQSLANAASYLVKGECVGIFPEGKSHDAVKVDKVKSGAARIAVQAVQQGATNLKIVPLGINYERKEKFRSAIWIRIGQPIDFAEWKTRIAEEERVAMRQLTNEIDLRLREIVIHLNEEKWEPFLDDLETLVPTKTTSHFSQAPSSRSIAALQQRKRIADAMNYFLAIDRPRAEAVAQEIETHRQKLERSGLTMQSDLFRLRYTRLFLRQTWDFIWILLGLIPMVVSTVYNLIPFLLVRLIAALLPKTNRTTISLTRLGLGIPIYGAWYAWIAWKLAQHEYLPWALAAWSALMFVMGIFTLDYWYRAREAAQLWWSELRMLLQKERLREFRSNHFELREKLEAMAAEFNPARAIEPPMERIDWSAAGKRSGIWAAATVIILAASLWAISRFNARPLPELAFGGPDLTLIPVASFRNEMEADEKALHDVILGLRDLESRVLKIREEFQSGQRDFYRQADNDLIRQLLLSYANYRTALLRWVWKYQRFPELPDENSRLRSFLMAYVSGCVLYETSLKFVAYFQGSSEAVRKLNEAEPLWQIPAGMFDSVRRDLGNSANRRLFADAATTYEEYKTDFHKLNLWSPEPFRLFHETIPLSVASIQKLQPTIRYNEIATTIGVAHDAGKEAVYRTKTVLSSWLGDTKIREPRSGESLIREKELHEFGKQLKPGDILLERRNWFVSNAFLPGFWPHSALYVGTEEDLRKLGLDQDANVKKHWKKFTAPDAEGHRHVIIESVSEGVVFSSLEHSIGGADAAAVLRPRLSEERLRQCIARAFSHVGKPYDFEFDFFSTDKLVCTELVYRTYDGDIDLPLVTILGTKTLPAIVFVKKFAEERGQPNAQMAFVTFLDGEESKGKAIFKNEEEFCKTVDRPALTWLQKK